MKGMTTCKVCGRDFPLMKEEHYIARDPEREGGQIGIVIAGKEEAKIFDAYDCTHCGCQNIMQERKKFYFGDNIKCDCDCDCEEEENE